jgi:plasmid stabilization system protein ParE
VRIIISVVAAADLRRIKNFLEAANPAAWHRAQGTIEDAIESLSDLPSRGRPVQHQGLRDLIVPFGRAAYIVRYQYVESRQAIFIRRIWHSREQRT